MMLRILCALFRHPYQWRLFAREEPKLWERSVKLARDAEAKGVTIRVQCLCGAKMRPLLTHTRDDLWWEKLERMRATRGR